MGLSFDLETSINNLKAEVEELMNNLTDDIIYPEEEWRPVVGYEGKYEVSNYGRVNALELTTRDKNGNLYYRKPQPIKIQTDRYGYNYVCLSKDGVNKKWKCHRLVGFAFIPNDDPEHKTLINHKNEIHNDNHVDNLEWCDYKYNSTYGTCIDRRAAKSRKPVDQYDLEGNYIASHIGIKEALINIGKYSPTNFGSLYYSLRNFNTPAHGYRWKFSNPNQSLK